MRKVTLMAVRVKRCANTKSLKEQTGEERGREGRQKERKKERKNERTKENQITNNNKRKERTTYGESLNPSLGYLRPLHRPHPPTVPLPRFPQLRHHHKPLNERRARWYISPYERHTSRDHSSGAEIHGE